MVYRSLLICLLSFAWIKQSTSYSLQEIFQDSLNINFHELIPYRGKILQDIWLQGSILAESRPKEADVCHELFIKALQTVNATWPPPEEIPAELKDAYTVGGKIHLISSYHKEQQNGGKGYVWDKAVIEGLRGNPPTPSICGHYQLPYCGTFLEKHRNLIHNLDGIVVGSQKPWAEADLFNLGIKNVITIEYMKIKTDYPGLSALHPSEVARSFLVKKWQQVDVAFSFSSLEHDGLGRYGDPLNPYGDLESIARIRCLLKPGGFLFLGVPMGLGDDTLVWNAHRIYGKYRTALMLMGWKILDILPEHFDLTEGALGEFVQPIMLLMKPYSSKK